MKRKFFTLFLSAMLLLALAVPAFADVIWIPEDEFFRSHECDRVDRPYETAGLDGKVTVFSEPGGREVSALKNGKQVTIQYTWEGNGASWGYLSYWDGEQTIEGWIPMDDMTQVYDSQSFFSDYAEEIQETDPVPVDFHEAVLYSYPNGPVVSTLKEDRDYQSFDELFTQIYTDKEGLRWSYVGYYMGRQSSWICLDDPMNEELDTGIVPAAPSAAQLRGSETAAAGPPLLLIAGVLVAAVVVVTAILLVRRKKPSKDV